MSSSASNRQPGEPIRLAYGEEPQQFGELYLPGGTAVHPVVVLIHGGFWRTPYNLSLMTGLALDLAQRGIAAWNIEYRRLGDPGGGWPGTMQDVARALDYLSTLVHTYALDLRRVITVGHSAGGHLALWLAGRSHIAKESELVASASPLQLLGGISLAGVLDLAYASHLHLGQDAVRELLGGTPEQVPERYSAASPSMLLPLGIPQILIHGTQDDRVPLEVSQVYLTQATDAGDQATLIELAGADHFVLIDASSMAWSITTGEIEKLLFPQ